MGVYQTQVIKSDNTLPTIVKNSIQPEVTEAITYNQNGRKYYFSNELGHKVIFDGGFEQRPMTKKEFKVMRAVMLSKAKTSSMEEKDSILEQITKLDFAEGHANKTFEVASSHRAQTGIGALVINIGNTRYIYNQEAGTVLHIDHSKRINGRMLQGEEKEQIIDKINSSKTMAKKLAKVTHQYQ